MSSNPRSAPRPPRKRLFLRRKLSLARPLKGRMAPVLDETTGAVEIHGYRDTCLNEQTPMTNLGALEGIGSLVPCPVSARVVEARRSNAPPFDGRPSSPPV